MIPDPANFVIGIHLLIGALVVLAVVLLVALAAYIAVRHYKRQAAIAMERRAAEAAKYRPDGLPYPPTGRGLCDRCHAVGLVYHAPQQKLCKTCYLALFAQGMAAAPTDRPAPPPLPDTPQPGSANGSA